MDERGWNWTPSEIRHAQLIEWLVQQSTERPGQGIEVEPFYIFLPDQSMNTSEIARGDLDYLESESLIRQMSGMGGIESLAAMITQEGRAFTERLQAARANKQRRRAAAHDAMVDWLYARDALRPPGLAWEGMLQDSARGYWFAEPFSWDEIDAASAWLQRRGLVDGTIIDQAEGPIIVYLTDTGVKCAEDFGSDTASYLEKQQYRAESPMLSVGTNSGQIQFAGDNAHQVQNIGVSADDLRVMIAGIAEIVRVLVPDAAGIDEEQESALAAVSETGVDRTRLERFRAWVVNTARAGASSGVVAVVSSATTTLLLQAEHLATHLG
jgi:hypothetical protein